MVKLCLSVLVGCFIFCITSHAHAQQLQKTYKDWNVYTMMQNGQKVCYMASAPKSKKGNYTKRGEPYILITHVKKDVDEVSSSSGYPYKRGKEVIVEIDKKKNKLFTKGELAWAYDSLQDKKMIKAMKKGLNLKVRGTSQRGTYSTDTYSLKGFTSAYKKMVKLCN